MTPLHIAKFVAITCLFASTALSPMASAKTRHGGRTVPRHSGKAPLPLSQVLDQIDKGTYRAPEIHSRAYCLGLRGAAQNACLDGTRQGIALYDGLKSYIQALPAQPMTQFTTPIVRLGKLRDALWSRPAVGSVMLAPLINRIIFQSVIRRVTFAPTAEVDSLKDAVSAYHFTNTEWKIVLPALEKEWRHPFKAGRPKDAAPTGYARLTYAWACGEVWKDEEWDTFTAQDIKSTLLDVTLRSHLYYLLGSLSWSASQQKTLSYYFQLRQRVGTFPDSVGEIVQVEMQPGIYSTKIEGSNQFEIWVKQFFPKIEDEMEEGEEWASGDDMPNEMIGANSPDWRHLSYRSLFDVFEWCISHRNRPADLPNPFSTRVY